MKLLSQFLSPVWMTLLLAIAMACPSLWAAWREAPLERWSGGIFILWLLPLLNHFGRTFFKQDILQATNSYLFSMAALACLALGALASLNVFLHVALALACSALKPFSSWKQVLWLLASLSWMPVTGWAMAQWSEPLTLMVRYGSVMLASLIIMISHRRLALTPAL